jgi:hypothetical protein
VKGEITNQRVTGELLGHDLLEGDAEGPTSLLEPHHTTAGLIPRAQCGFLVIVIAVVTTATARPWWLFLLPWVVFVVVGVVLTGALLEIFLSFLTFKKKLDKNLFSRFSLN